MRLYRMDPMRDGSGEFWSQSLLLAALRPRADVDVATASRWPSGSSPPATRATTWTSSATSTRRRPASGSTWSVVSADAELHLQALDDARGLRQRDRPGDRARRDRERAALLRLRRRRQGADRRRALPPARVAGLALALARRDQDQRRRRGDLDASRRRPTCRSTPWPCTARRSRCSPAPSYHGQRYPEPPLELFLAGDRPIYRPGQTAQGARDLGRARARTAASRSTRIASSSWSLRDPNGKEVWHADLVTGAMGSAATEFKLPDKGLLGVHTHRRRRRRACATCRARCRCASRSTSGPSSRSRSRRPRRRRSTARRPSSRAR